MSESDREAFARMAKDLAGATQLEQSEFVASFAGEDRNLARQAVWDLETERHGPGPKLIAQEAVPSTEADDAEPKNSPQ